ncbi:MAG: pitrilysin family protein [Bacteroidota bacterium]
MKNFHKYLILVLAFVAQFSFAQNKSKYGKSGSKYYSKSKTTKLDRSKLPEPAPAPIIKIGKAENFTLDNGLKVYVVKNSKLPRVAFNLVLDRDPLKEGNLTGLTSVVGDLLSTGTKNLSKDQYDEQVDFIGANITTSSTGIYGASLKKHTEKLLTLMSDVLLNPYFKQEELDKIKKQMKSNLASSKDNPNSIASKVASVVLFGKNHPYGEQITNQTVDNITIDACNNYYNTFFKSNIGYLAVVGDIDAEEAKALVMKYFGSWKGGSVPRQTIEIPKEIAKTKVILVDRPSSVQSVISIVNTADLKIGSPDVIKSRITNDILGGGEARLYNNLREKHGYTYGAYSSLSSDKYIGKFSAGASVRNAVTDSALTELMYELKQMRNAPPTEEELFRTKNDLNGTFVFSLESPQTVANFAINTARYNLPGDYYSNYLKNIEQTTEADVHAMALKYIKPDNSYIVVVGKASEIAEKLKKFGEIEYYDTEGNKVEPPAPPKAIAKGVTVENILEKYINAIGGKDKISAINEVDMTFSGQIPNGPALTVSIAKKSPDKSLQEIKVMGNVMQKMVVNGAAANMTQRGQEVEVKGADLQQAVAKAFLFYELNPSKAGLKTSLEGTEKIEGKDCTKIGFSVGDSKWVEYFDNATGLKIRSLETKKGPSGDTEITVDYSDYKETDGVKFPSVLKQNMGPMVLEIKLESIKLNKGIDDKLFNLK